MLTISELCKQKLTVPEINKVVLCLKMEGEEKKLMKRLQRARESGKFDDWEQCCRRLAELRVSLGRYEDALKAYQEELSVCEANSDAAGTATAHRMVGEMYSTLGQFPESLDHVNKYLTYSKQSKNSVEEQRAYATIGRTYFCWAAELKSSEAEKDKIKSCDILRECRKAYMKSLYICEQELKSIGIKERQEMKARLLFNLGLASEIEDDLSGALSYVSKSIIICKQEALFEDLQRCYMSQSTLFLKQLDFTAAASSVDLAIEVAKRLPNTEELTVLALLHKAEIFFAMANYNSAKRVLKKAYKMKSPNEDDLKTVETCLKRAVVLCDIELKLSRTEKNNFAERKILYEKLGDACCSVKNFNHAIKSYQEMLNCSLNLGLSGRDLQPCFVSLYQTYKDDKQYELALEYARKEFEVSKTNPLEAAKSHIAIGEILEMKGAPYLEVSEEYLSAKELARASNEILIQQIALKKLLALQQAYGKTNLSFETEKELSLLGDIHSDESESSDDSLTGVNLSDLSDSDEEAPRAVRAARNSFKLTRNEKGETPLHVAAIRGDVTRAKRLLSLGHPVKERDLAGWTPLHEAANHGYIEMVEVLLEAGADVNDAGGRDCGGVTPLHDAASCGHFDIIKLLLEHRASVTVLTDANETPLDCLKAWRKRVGELTESDEAIYKEIKECLSSKLEALGFPNRHILEKKKSIKKEKCRPDENTQPLKSQLNLRREISYETKKSKNWGLVSPEKRQRTPSPISSPPRRINESPTKIMSPDMQQESSPIRPVADYRAAISGLRKRPAPFHFPKPRIESALLDESSYVDEWLEDDLRMNQKKKRKNNDSGNNLVNPSSSRVPDDDNDFFFPLDDPADFCEIVDEQSRKKSKLQSTLLDAGFTSVSEPSVSNSVDIPSRPVETSQDFPSLPSPPFSSVSDQQLTKVRVNVGRLTLLIPVDCHRSEELTVQWLAEETAKRYSKIEGVEPNLQLKTRDGAIMSTSDPVSVALGEDLESNILGWKTSNLTQRYRNAVSIETPFQENSFGSYIKGPDRAVIEKLEKCELSHNLDLQYMALTNSELNPILKALKHEKNLRVLNLNGNVLGDSGLETLIQCLESCSIGELNIRCNNITAKGISLFLENLKTKNSDFRSTLCTLDLSFNPTGEIDKEQLSTIFPNLKILTTDNCENLR